MHTDIMHNSYAYTHDTHVIHTQHTRTQHLTTMVIWYVDGRAMGCGILEPVVVTEYYTKLVLAEGNATGMVAVYDDGNPHTLN